MKRPGNLFLAEARRASASEARPESASDSGALIPNIFLTVMGTDLIIDTTAEVAQVVEHGTENAGVDSSSLSLGTTYMNLLRFVPGFPGR